jgi:flagellar basal-body rod modification protein FlgD
MSAVQQTTSSTNAYAASGTAKAPAKTDVEESQDRFLKLLVTQMKNQDPLNPLDNAQVTSQMAQLSTVSGINKLNSSIESLSGMFQSNQLLQASGMIGRGVLAEGSDLRLTGGKAIGGIELPQAADKVVVTIADRAGKVLQTVDMGAQNAGVLSFQWDGGTDSGGKAADGAYKFSVKAVLGGKAAEAQPLSLGIVGSVSVDSQGITLNADGLGALALSKIKQIL